MNKRGPEDVTFQVTVKQLLFSPQIALSTQFSKQDIRVTVCVGDLSKITCSGELSEDKPMIRWNHPFLFSAPLSATVRVAIWVLPEKLTIEWDKQPLGDQMITTVENLLVFNNGWQCSVPGLTVVPATLSMVCMASDLLAMPDGHDCLFALASYHQRLFDFGEGLKTVPCTLTAIELGSAGLDLCPFDDEEHFAILSRLAGSFGVCYYQLGNVAALNRAIEMEQDLLDHYPLGHPDHIDALGSLALRLRDHYFIQKNKDDLIRLLGIQERLLGLCPLGHEYHGIALLLVSESLHELYNMEGNIANLNRAIQLAEKSLEVCPLGHPVHDMALSNLAITISTHYQRQRNLEDLNKVIHLQEQLLKLCPPDHIAHGFALQHLAMSLQAHFSEKKNYSDLIKAIKLLQEALNNYSVEYPEYAKSVQSLAAATLLSLKSGQPHHLSINHPLSTLDEAFETYKLLKRCLPAVSLYLMEAIQSWVQDAEEYNHPSALEAYQTSLDALDLFTSINSSLHSRHETMQARVADQANDAFSCAVRHGDFQMAIELLERGRGILWNQLSRFDISVANLVESHSAHGHELGRRFTRLCTDLRTFAEGSRDRSTDSYWRVQEQWQSTVEAIRNLDGFSRFLSPPCFDDLQHAAECGPVIVVNASKFTCGALIILSTGPPVHVPLPCSLADVEQLCAQLSELTQDPHAYGENREFWMKQMLRDLWSSVVESIFTVLQNTIQIPVGSRIWWCPTSKFTILPFHAAGPYRRGRKNFMDTYISSYAPSLSGLIRTRERIRSQKKARDASGTANVISFAAVGQARPSTDVKLGELVEVEHEIARIRDETNMPPNVTFETVSGSKATIEGTVQAFRDHRWVHVACHGAQHAKKPFESWFAMGDGKLTLKRVIQERYTNSEFAFLSACHTALGDASTPDEVLHLAAGMQFAGFNGVIGTLWRVDDAVAHRFVTRFYKEMFKHPVLDFEHAAAALNTAALETEDEVSLEKRIVFVHIGI